MADRAPFRARPGRQDSCCSDTELKFLNVLKSMCCVRAVSKLHHLPQFSIIPDLDHLGAEVAINRARCFC
jgi:hypothetical protein